jgi:cysteine synthase A
MQQYHDPVHCLGYARAAALIEQRIPPGPLTLTGGVGSGASTAGLATYLRAFGRRVRLVGVQPFGSVTFGSDAIEDRQILIAGIGSSIAFRNVKHELYDRVHWVGFAPAASGAIGLLRRSAIFAGLSTGAAYLASRWEQLRDESSVHLFIGADTGHRYVDQVFSRHSEFRDMGLWVPSEVASLSELESPWSAMCWSGRDAPGAMASPPDGGLRQTRQEMMDQ